jgi:hypothetical protein
MRDAPSVTALRLPPTVLPGGDERDVWVAGGVFTTTPGDGAEPLPRTPAAIVRRGVRVR